MPSLRKRGNVWYYRFTTSSGMKCERRGCASRRDTEVMAGVAELEAANVRAGVIDSRALGFRDHDARPLADHLADWYRDMIAREKTAKHANQYLERAGKLAALVRGASLAEIEPGRKAEARERGARVLADVLTGARLTDLAPDRIQAALGRLRDAGKSLQTANHYRAALRAFVRWCSDSGRLRDNPMRGVRGFNPEEDPRHVRRTLTAPELARLVVAAENGPMLHGMPGPLRAMAYRLAVATGFRAEELRTLLPDAFHLDGLEPTIFLTASATKNRRPAEQPIPLALACDLARWLADKPAGVPVLPLHRETARAIRRDLASAGIPYETDEGVADFHSLRGYYVGALVKAGASISEVRALARHAKAETTLKHYARVSAHDMRGVVDSLPVLTSPAPRTEPAALAATGTEGGLIGERPAGVNPVSRFAHSLPTVPQGSGCDLTATDGSDEATGENRDTPGTPTFEGSGRVLTASDGSRTERGGFEPPVRFDPYNGLANRRFRPLSHLSRGHSQSIGSKRTVARLIPNYYQISTSKVNRMIPDPGTSHLAKRAGAGAGRLPHPGEGDNAAREARRAR
jgi:site-specific recombinase XerC